MNIKSERNFLMNLFLNFIFQSNYNLFLTQVRF